METSSLSGRIVLGAFGMIEEVDDAFCALVGYPRAELLEMHGADLIPVARQPAVALAIDRMKPGEVNRETGVLRRRDGSVVEVEVEATPLASGGVAMRVRGAAKPGPAED